MNAQKTDSVSTCKEEKNFKWRDREAIIQNTGKKKCFPFIFPRGLGVDTKLVLKNELSEAARNPEDAGSKV